MPERVLFWGFSSGVSDSLFASPDPSIRPPAAWLCFLMLSRDLKTFSRAVSRLRSQKARLEFAVAGSDKSGGGAQAAQEWEDIVQQEADVARDVAPSSRGRPPADLHGTTLYLAPHLRV